MRQMGWALIPSDWGPHKKRKLFSRCPSLPPLSHPLPLPLSPPHPVRHTPLGEAGRQQSADKEAHPAGTPILDVQPSEP